ncbi:MAG: hypothetical protein H7281_13835, partial [Bacteriovorax sp.]|nr:hypothetical protein [Bacteriovorax sp.]
MKFLFTLTTLTTLLCSMPSHALDQSGSVDKGIYGDDNRKLVSELDGQFNEIQIEQSRAVLAQVPKWRITSEDKTSISIKTKSLASG